VEDVGQRTNLATEHPDRVAALVAALEAIRKRGHSAPRLAP
jgi:hypothetical protein